MYLVELESGKDTVYQSTDALTAAIRRGELDSTARIYHRATCQWLPITVHPEFRRRMGARERRTGAPASRRQWTFLREEVVEADAPEPLPAGPALIEGDPPPTWRQSIGLAFRRLRLSGHPRTN